MKRYIIVQGVSLLIHTLTDVAQVAYGRFAPLSLIVLFGVSIVASLAITHIIWYIAKNKKSLVS